MITGLLKMTYREAKKKKKNLYFDVLMFSSVVYFLSFCPLLFIFSLLFT